MTTKTQKSNESSKKRKHITASDVKSQKPNPKKVKLPSNPPKKSFNKPSVPSNKGVNRPFTLTKHKQQHHEAKPKIERLSESGQERDEQEKKRERRLHAKELTEARKKKRKRHYTLEQELASLWEKMRVRNITKEDRSKFVSEALKKMRGKIPEIASSHVSSRVLQTCVKYCSQDERDAAYKELRPHFLTLACNTYAVHLLTKMLDNASKGQLAEFISSLHGHVASLLRHMVGSLVIEHAYQLGNATQKQTLLVELYSTELQLFKDLVSVKESRLVDIISKLRLQKASVLRHMSSVLQPILEKGILDHSIVHRALIDYFSIADQSSAADVVQQLSGPLVVRMIGSKDGSTIGMLCIKHGSAKERKKIIKGMKDHIGKIARDRFGSMVLVCILSIVDDTKLITKVVLRQLETILAELILDKDGRRPLLQLLHPNCTRYFSPDDLASLNLSIPSLCPKEDSEINTDLGKQTRSSDVSEAGEDDKSGTNEINDKADRGKDPSESLQLIEGGKKDPFIRRQELLVNSGFAKSLIDACREKAAELLKSNFGKDVIYEVITGGADGILHPTLDEELDTLHETIASLVAQPKSEAPGDGHLLEHFHSSRIIRKLVLDCPTFASTLWEKALKGKCEIWVHGHSCKVIRAYWETSNSAVRELAKDELQALIQRGILKFPSIDQSTKAD